MRIEKKSLCRAQNVIRKYGTQLLQKVNPKCTVTGQHCQTKVNGLKKTYKKILDHNSVSGNDRKTWAYFEVIIYLY